MLKELMKPFLGDYYFYILTAHLLLIFALIWINFSEIRKQFLKVTKRTWLLVLFICIFSLFLRVELSPLMDRTYSTAWGDKVVARYFLLERKPSSCQRGSYDDCEQIIQLYGRPPGVSYLLSWFFLFFGIDNKIVFYFSVIIGSLTTIIIFLLSYILFKQERAALFSALIFGILPMHIFFSGDSLNMSPSLFLILLTVLFFLIALKVDTWRMYFLAFLVFVLSSEVRLENVFLIIPLVISFLIFRWKEGSSFRKFKSSKKLIFPLLISIILGSPLFYYYRFHGEMGFYSPTGTFNLIYLPLNFSYLIEHFVTFLQNAFHIVFSLFIFIALFYFGRYKKQFIFLLFWFLTFTAVYLFYYVSLQMRYILMLYLSLVLLFGLGVQAFIEKLKCKGKLLPLLIVILLVFSVGLPGKILRNERIDYGWPYQTAYDIQRAVKKIDKTSYVVLPSMEEVSLLQFSTQKKGIFCLSALEFKEISEQKQDRIYFFKSWRCEAPITKVNCRDLENNYKLKFLFKEGEVRVYEIVGKTRG